MCAKIFPIAIFSVLLTGLHATGTAQTMRDLTARSDRAICRELRPDAKDCRTVMESATQNALLGGDSLWGFSYSFHGEGVKSAKDATAIKAALQTLGAGVLELEKNRIAAISYYRESKGKLTPILPEDFHKLALNPVSGIVARLDTGFLASGGEVTYQAPDTWRKEGAPAASSGLLELTVTPPKTGNINLAILNLDDQKHPTVSVNACHVKTAQGDVPCNIAGIGLRAGLPTTIALELKLARNLRTEQPAFKLVAKTANDAPVLLNLAIPFRPRPNYFLFGVTGFIFGGLIAVMVLIGKRKKIEV